MPNVPYSYEVNGKLVMGNGSLIPISSLTKRSLLPSLTVFCFQNCSSDREKLLKFEAEGQEIAKFSRSLKVSLF